jgi:hypothetical protein
MRRTRAEAAARHRPAWETDIGEQVPMDDDAVDNWADLLKSMQKWPATELLLQTWDINVNSTLDQPVVREKAPNLRPQKFFSGSSWDKTMDL